LKITCKSKLKYKEYIAKAPNTYMRSTNQWTTIINIPRPRPSSLYSEISHCNNTTPLSNLHCHHIAPRIKCPIDIISCHSNLQTRVTQHVHFSPLIICLCVLTMWPLYTVLDTFDQTVTRQSNCYSPIQYT